MPVPKANYHKIAETFDKGRILDKPVLDVWLQLVKDYGRVQPGMKILDLGCGTGRFTIPFATELGLVATGADAFPEMLAKARAKENADMVTWDVQDADYLTYPQNTFDIVFMSHLLHHVESPEGVIRNSRHIVRPLGAILVRHGAMEYIADDVEHRFFEGATAIDEERTLTTEGVEDLLRQQGLHEVTSIEITQRTYSTAEDHVERASHKFTSVLHLISNEAFRQGLVALTEYAQVHPEDPWLLEDKMTLSVGYKT